MDQKMFYQIAVAEAKEGEMLLATCLEGEQAGSKALFHEGGLLTAIPQTAGQFWQQVSVPQQGDFCGVFTDEKGTSVFCDPLVPEPKLIIVGAGHVARSLAAMARECGFTVFVVDERPELLTAERFPGCTLFDDYTAGLMPFSGGNCYFAVLAHDHATSLSCMTTILRRRYAFAGMIGAEKNRQKIEEALHAAGLPEQKLADLVLPIGLSIGAETPQEIAVAILAQLIARRRELTGGVVCHIPVYQTLSRCDESQVLVTVINSDGPVPRGPGAKLCLSASGSQIGTVGGGSVERQALAYARQTLADGQLRRIKVQAEAGGTAELFIEHI